jgi:hypothetical protein
MTEQLLLLGRLIELAGAAVVLWYVARASLAALRGQGAINAHILMAGGVLAALNLMVAATLLKTIALHNWRQIGMFTFVLGLRTVMKHVFAWERAASTGCGQRI